MRYLFSWYTAYAYSLFIIVLSVIPVEPPPQLVFPLFDKVLHCLAYTILSFVVVNVSYRKSINRPRFFSFSYAFTLGLLIEIVQFFLPFRQFEAGDIACNFLGSIVGCLIKIV